MLNYLTFNTSKRLLVDCMVKRSYCQALYTQGQRVDKKIREYFYYIDHEGMVNKWLFQNFVQNALNVMVKRVYRAKIDLSGVRLTILCTNFIFSLALFFPSKFQQLFLDDARIKNFTSCFKDKPFLRFFFKRLRFNATPRYQNEFPYVSLCGTERNYIRCDDLPIVFTDVIANDKGKWIFLLFPMIREWYE